MKRVAYTALKVEKYQRPNPGRTLIIVYIFVLLIAAILLCHYISRVDAAQLPQTTVALPENADLSVENDSAVQTPAEPVDRGRDESRETLIGTFEITYYTNSMADCGKTDGITKTGTLATVGRTIVVDPEVIPFGTHVLINGHEYVAEDCGGDIKGYRIDIFVGSDAEANRLGRTEAEVYLRQGGSEK